MTYLEAKKALARKLNIDWTDIANNDLFTEEDIGELVNAGAMQGYEFDFWDFAEHSKTATLVSGDVTKGYIAYPQDIMPSSIYYMTVDGKEFNKKNFTSFKKYFEDYSNGTEKIWAEFKRLLFFNKNLMAVGSVIDIYGRRGFQALVNDTDILPFSPDTDNEQYSGNQACILYAYAEALGSEKKKNPAQSTVEHQKAEAILARLSNQLKQGRASEQVKNRSMFNVPDMFKGGRNGSSNIGTFSN